MINLKENEVYSGDITGDETFDLKYITKAKLCLTRKNTTLATLTFQNIADDTKIELIIEKNSASTAGTEFDTGSVRLEGGAQPTLTSTDTYLDVFYLYGYGGKLVAIHMNDSEIN